MSRPSFPNHAIRFVAALALLVSVMTSPIRTSKAAVSTGTSAPDCLHCNFDVPGKTVTPRPHVPVTSRVVVVKALSTQSELDLIDTPDGHRFDLHAGPSAESRPDSASSRLPEAAHPLRC
jgi:hypothetical protein